MTEAIWGVLLPSGLALAGVTLTALVGKRKGDRDNALGFVAVLQAERVTAEARADKAEARLEREAASRRRAQVLSWRYHQQLLKAGLEPDPAWPTEESERVTV